MLLMPASAGIIYMEVGITRIWRYHLCMHEIIWFLLLGLVAWFWWDSTRAKEVGVRAARRACERHQLQLLDDTVALSRLRTGRNARGQMQWRRAYQFEFTRDDEVRSHGTVELLGCTVTGLHLEMGPFDLYEQGD